MDDVGLMVLMCISWLLLMTLPQFLCEPHPPSYDYSLCKEPYKCGNVSSVLFFPFWGQNRPPFCGGGPSFELSCHHDDSTMSVEIASLKFKVEKINTTTKTLRVVPIVKDKDVCSSPFLETYVKLFRYPGTGTEDYSITIFHQCPTHTNFHDLHNFTCGDARYYFGKVHELKDCKVYWTIPAHYPELYISGGGGVGVDDLKYLKQGFDVNYDVPQHCTACPQIEGSCKTDEDVVPCYYCTPQSDAPHCIATSNMFSYKRKLVLAFSCAVIGGFMIWLIIWYKKCLSKLGQMKFSSTIRNDQDIESFFDNHGPLTQRRYKFSEVKKMTNSFKVKLGEGGFGAVYKGEILSGCPVAVKILNASKGNGEEIINEIASISRTSHVNVVTLLGFCLEGKKKALVYEFMPNGSLDKFIYNKGLETTQWLSWENLWQIAVGIARGLEYLHRGCNTRILHFDIKPHNILLDENFQPKISDFGLAKLCPRKESIISMSDARGTIGYVAPEMLGRHIGGISYKSDVYSYGMMLIDMVGARKNINAEAGQTSEYFPDWIYNRLEQGGDLRTDAVIAAEENEIEKRMIVVGLWCIQTFPKDRPTMSKVIEMLQGNMNSLEMPPKPVFSSPARSTPEFSTSSLQSGGSCK